MEKSQVWVALYAAALGGMLSAETESFHYGHKQDIAKHAGSHADFGLAEYAKRFGNGPLPGTLMKGGAQ